MNDYLSAQSHKFLAQLQSVDLGLDQGIFALQDWPKNGQKVSTPIGDFICKSLIIKWLPRMDSNHDKVIQSHIQERK